MMQSTSRPAYREPSEIADDRGALIAGIDVEHDTARDPISTGANREVVFLHLEHDAADIGRVPLDELLDVVAVDRRAPFVAPVPADGTRAVGVTPLEAIPALVTQEAPNPADLEDGAARAFQMIVAARDSPACIPTSSRSRRLGRRAP
jgi:hypothetical protein